jgi:hypothetical protein
MDELVELLEKRKELRLGFLTGGEDEETLLASNDLNFRGQLKSILDKNNRWLIALFIILILLTVFISVIIWDVRSQKGYVIALLGGGQGIGIAAIISRLTALYDKKRTSELLLFLYQAATTEKEKQKTLGELISFLKKHN